jgi:hypothetical protein
MLLGQLIDVKFEKYYYNKQYDIVPMLRENHLLVLYMGHSRQPFKTKND